MPARPASKNHASVDCLTYQALAALEAKNWPQAESDLALLNSILADADSAAKNPGLVDRVRLTRRLMAKINRHKRSLVNEISRIGTICRVDLDCKTPDPAIAEQKKNPPVVTAN